MDNRTQFTFYESFYKAVSRIKKAADRAVAYDAICAYALYGTEPDLDKLPAASAIAFELIKPNLDASRKKAKSGKKGGESKQTESKPKANDKQTATEKEKEKENKKEKEKENECYKENKKETAAEPPAPPRQNIDYEAIKDLYNTVCVSFPRCTSLSEARKKAIKARFANGYTVEDFRALFTKAEASSFLKGKNDRNWTANFDWLLKDANMAKVLDGNYVNKDASGAPIRREEPPEWMMRHIKPKTAGEDPAIKARADALKSQLKGE